MATCPIHPDTEEIKGAVKTKKGWRLALTCSKCDELVAYLKVTKVTKERYIK